MHEETDNYKYSPAKLDLHLATGGRFYIQDTEVGVETDRSKQAQMAGKCTRETGCHGHLDQCVCVYVKAVSVKRNDYTEPSCKSYCVVTDALADRLMPSRLAAFLSIATQL